MMRLADLLADFSGTSDGAGDASGPRAQPREQERRDLAAFDQGYRAGWDDAMRAVEEDGKRIQSDFAQNLQDLSFTYHEAYSHILAAMEPLLFEIAETILPAAIHDSIGGHIVEKLLEQARKSGALDVVIAVAPSELHLVEPLVEAEKAFPVKLVADGALIPGQADIRFGENREERIDLSEIADGIREAVAGFSADTRRETHG